MLIGKGKQDDKNNEASNVNYAKTALQAATTEIRAADASIKAMTAMGQPPPGTPEAAALADAKSRYTEAQNRYNMYDDYLSSKLGIVKPEKPKPTVFNIGADGKLTTNGDASKPKSATPSAPTQSATKVPTQQVKYDPFANLLDLHNKTPLEDQRKQLADMAPPKSAPQSEQDTYDEVVRKFNDIHGLNKFPSTKPSFGLIGQPSNSP